MAGAIRQDRRNVKSLEHASAIFPVERLTRLCATPLEIAAPGGYETTYVAFALKAADVRRPETADP